MNTLPKWLTLLSDRIAREIPGFASEFDAVVLRPDLDAMRTPILVRILEEIALPSVTVDNWGVIDVVRGVIDALRSGDTGALRKARATAAAATWVAETTEAAAWAAAEAAAAWAAVATAAWAAAEAAATTTVWRKIADIVIEEVSQ